MEVVGAAQIGVGDHRRRLGRGCAIELGGDDRGDAFGGERADRDGAAGHGLGAFGGQPVNRRRKRALTQF